MEFKFKKVALAVAALSLASTAFAAQHHRAQIKNRKQSKMQITKTGEPVPVAHEISGLFIGANGLYLQPRNGDLDYAYSNTENVTGGTDTNVFAVRPRHRWGYDIFGGLKFGDNDDLTIEYMNFRNAKASASVGPASPYTYIARFLAGGERNYNQAFGHTKNSFETWSAVVAHTKNLSPLWSIRVGAGIQHSNLESSLVTGINNLTALNEQQQVVPRYARGVGVSSSKFNGTGPKAVADLTMHVTHDINVFVNTRAALLFGLRKVNAGSTLFENPAWFVDPSDAGIRTNSFHASSRNVAVTNLGIRAGVSYTHPLNFAHLSGSSITIQGGWQGETFLHAVERPVFNNHGGAGEISQKTKVSNLSNQGLFAGIKICSADIL